MLNKKLSKKSQLTVFMLMAVVALVIFGFVYFSKSESSESQVKAEEEKLVTNRQVASQVEFFVQACLDKSFQESLELISRQGGYIMQEQRGSMIPFAIPNANYTIDNKTYLIAYRITRDQKDLLPKYPCKDTAAAPLFCMYVNDAAQYAKLNEITYGMTKNIIVDGQSAYLTLQKQIERYVENQTLECINFSNFAGFNATFENASATATIQDEQVSVTLFLPITVLIQDLSPVIQKFKFSSLQRARLKKVHNAVQELLNVENKEVDFRLKEDGAAGKFKNTIFRNKELNLEIEKISNVKENDDLFIFTDAKSRLAGRPLKYAIIRENRMPALDLIRQTSINPNYEVLISPGQKLEFKPKASDPDEDKIIYSYDGYSDDDRYLEKAKRIAEALTDSVKQQEGDCENRCASYEATENDEGEYIITVKASDGEFTDFQNVRVKVSSRILAVPNVYSLYGFIGDKDEKKAEKAKWLSNEEAAFFDASGSLLPDPGAEYNYIWLDRYFKQADSAEQNGQINKQINEQITADEFLKEKCIAKFGDALKPCEDVGSILDIKKPITLNPTIYANTGRKPAFSFDAVKKTDDDGDYYGHNITLSVNGEQSQDSIESTEVKVKDCLPYEVRTSPSDYPDLTQTYPFMYARKSNQPGYYDITVPYDLNTASSLDFKGAHTGQGDQKTGCCTKDGKRELTSKVCFEYTTRMMKDYLETNNFDAVKILKTKLVKDSTAMPQDGSLQVLDSVPFTKNTCDTSPCKITFRQYCGQRGNACSGRIEWEIVNS